MGISFVEAKTNLESLQKDYQDFHDEVWKDSETYNISAESLKIAVATMRKYQKIVDLVYSWSAWNKDNYRLYRLREIIEEQEDG